MSRQSNNENSEVERLTDLQREVLRDMYNSGKDLEGNAITEEHKDRIKMLIIEDASRNPRYRDRLQQIKWEHQKNHLFNDN